VLIRMAALVDSVVPAAPVADINSAGGDGSRS